MSDLSTNYCPYCGREIPQSPIGALKKEYCYDNCPEGDGKRISILSLRPKKDYPQPTRVTGLGAFPDPDELTGKRFKDKRQR